MQVYDQPALKGRGLFSRRHGCKVSFSQVQRYESNNGASQNMHTFLAKRFLFPRWEEMIAVVVSIAEKMERELET